MQLVRGEAAKARMRPVGVVVHSPFTSVAETLITIAASATLLRRWQGTKPFSNTLLHFRLHPQRMR
ncbi:hypothetical protein CHELA17_62194 [Chelatococcus asaccharovorans]|nr:hypothetical protein CHELA17_62194 [Chelatococcus asaccharovorans]